MERIVTDSDEKQWGMFVHLAALVTLIGIPLGNVIGPLIIYLIKKDEYGFVAEQGKEVLNFQITWSLDFYGFSDFDNCWNWCFNVDCFWNCLAGFGYCWRCDCKQR